MILDGTKIGLRSIWANPLRSTLSMLGIVFGVGTLIATLAIGEGTKRQIVKAIKDIGSNLIIIEEAPPSVIQRKASRGLTLRDVELLREHCTLIESVAGVQLVSPFAVSYRGKTIYPPLSAHHPNTASSTTAQSKMVADFSHTPISMRTLKYACSAPLSPSGSKSQKISWVNT